MNTQLIGLLTTSEVVAMEFCKDKLAQMDYIVISDDTNFVFGIPTTKYITPVMLLAHLDTCRKSDNVLPGVFANTIYNANAAECGCLGADDRAGVHICLTIAEALGQKPYVLLTTGEETGHFGMAAFLKAQHPEMDDVDESFWKDKALLEPYMDDIYALLQYDRRGMSDVVTYGASALEYDLIAKAELLGYIHTRGSTSDSRDFSSATNIPHLNLSAGFAHEHTENELLILPAVEHAINNGIILCQMIDRPFRILPKPTFTYIPKEELPPRKEENTFKPCCDVCEKHRRVTYLPEIMACVCSKCLRRIYDKYGFEYSHYSVKDFKYDLELDRSRSKDSNLPFKVSCPVDHTHENIHRLRDDVMFCDDCGVYFWQYDKGVYWWDVDSIDAQIYHRFWHDGVSVQNVDLAEEQCPLGLCQMCGKIKPDKNLAYYDNEEIGDYTLVVCDDCNMIDRPIRRKSNGR